MGLVTRVSKNTSILIAARIGEKVLNFLLVVVLVRYLAEETLGQYGFISSFVALFSVLAGLGFASLCTREIARHPELAPGMLTAALVPMALSSLFALAAIAAAVAVTKEGQTVVITATCLAAVNLMLSAITSLFEALPRAHERMIYSAVPLLIRSALLLLSCSLLLPLGLGLVGVYGLVVGTGVVHLALQVISCRVVFKAMPSRQFDRELCRGLFKEAYPLAISSLFVIIYYRIDSVMLSYMKGDREVGFYMVATSLAFAAFFLAQAFHQASYPALAKLYVEERHRLDLVYRRSMKYLAILGLPLSCGLLVLAPRVIALVYGDRYLPSSLSFRVLTVALAFMFLNGYMANTLIVASDQRVLMRIVGFGAALNVGLNLVVIPRYGLHGAAAATVVAEMFAGVASWIALWRRHGITASFLDLFRVAFCCAAMGGLLIAASDWPLPITVSSAVLLYLVLLLISRTVSREEIEEFLVSLKGAARKE